MSFKSTMQPDAKEALLLMHVILNTGGNPKIDWAKVAAGTGLKNAGTASTRFGQVKRKLMEKNGIYVETPTRTPTSKKRKAAVECEAPSGGKKKVKKEEHLRTPSPISLYDSVGYDEKEEFNADDEV